MKAYIIRLLSDELMRLPKKEKHNALISLLEKNDFENIGITKSDSSELSLDNNGHENAFGIHGRHILMANPELSEEIREQAKKLGYNLKIYV